MIILCEDNKDQRLALRLASVLGVESAITNGPAKWCFRRVRPALEHAERELPYGMHRPITSSFLLARLVSA